MKKKKLVKGFTLVELLAVIAITGVVGTLMFGILFTTLRGASKSDSMGTIQKNGDFVMSQISRTIRFASALDTPSTCYTAPTPTPVVNSSITVLDGSNRKTTYACDTTAGTISSNSAVLLDPNEVVVTACSFSCQQLTPNDFPTFTIVITLNKKDNNSLSENNSALTFQTSVTMRNVR
ncbi:MAG: type II secretion system protein [Candidatus Levybacteria bacterium]|nr:type II secretion system protein [Candidatus Levybacteria bacterium]